MLGTLLVGAGVVFASIVERGESVAMPAATAAPALPKVVALGRVEPLSRVIHVSAPAASGSSGAGRVWSTTVKEGQSIRAGQPLAVLDTEPTLRAAVEQAEAQVLAKRVELAKTVADLDSQERSLAAALAQQEAERDRVQWDYDKMTQFKVAGMYSDAALTDKRLALLSAQRRVETARLALDRVRVRDGSGPRLDEAVAQTALGAAQAALAKARADHDLAFVTTPIAGRVLRLTGKPGESIGADGFAEVGDTSTMMVRAEVFEADLRFVSVGQIVEATSRSIDIPLTGRVEQIGLRVGQQSIVREDPAAALDTRVFEVLVRLDEASSREVENMSNLQVRVAMRRPDVTDLADPDSRSRAAIEGADRVR